MKTLCSLKTGRTQILWRKLLGGTRVESQRLPMSNEEVDKNTGQAYVAIEPTTRKLLTNQDIFDGNYASIIFTATITK